MHKVKRATLSLSILVVGGISALGCGTNANNSSTGVVTQIPAGSTCANGGVQISSSGKPTQTLCNGTAGSNGTNTLAITTQLQPGDTNCPTGGVKIDTGLDNGVGGGTANNGKLEAGEIVSTQYVCNGGTNAILATLLPPDGAAGTNILRVAGGTGTGGIGGNGGSADIEFDYGSFGGNLKVFRTGTADAGFTFPAATSGDLGLNPATVVGAKELTVQASNPPSPALAVGTLFLYGTSASGNLWVQDSAATSKLVTGLKVAAGATVTFDETNISPSRAFVAVPLSCQNSGKLTAKGTDLTQATGIRLRCADYFGAPGSSVNTMGADGSAVTPGLNGGDIDVEAVVGAFYNQGNFTANGGQGSAGGKAGQAVAFGQESVYNTGSFTAVGGAGLATGSKGGDGNAAMVHSGGGVHNSGNIDASAGKGKAYGGTAGLVTVKGGDVSGGVGDILNSGTLTSNGGDVDASCTSGCIAGNGNAVVVSTMGGGIANSASLRTLGGSSPAGTGGIGGALLVQSRDDAAYYNVYGALRNTVLAASMDASGGSGLAGGNAGSVSIRIKPRRAPNGQEIILNGFTTVDTEGGAGTLSGGNGGHIAMFQHTNFYNNLGPGGAVVNYADLTSQGGSASAGLGGRSGYVDLETQGRYYIPGPHAEQLLNFGVINANGGNGTTGGGTTDYVYMYGADGVTNTGAITARGGNATAGPGGSIGSDLVLVSDNGPCSNTGNIDVSGGNGTGAGQSGGFAYAKIAGGDAAILLAGMGTTNSGTLFANGGNGDATTGTGGNGGSVQLLSLSGRTNNTVAVPSGIAVKGGTGYTAGQRGVVKIDGQLVTPLWSN